MSKPERIVISGMAINTPIGDTLDGFLANLYAGKSALSNWKTIDISRCYSKVGADLSEYDWASKLQSYEGRIPADVWKRARKLISKSPWTTKLTILLALDGFLDAGLFGSGLDLDRTAAIVAGHNINFNYQYEQRLQYVDEPDFMDSLLALTGLDTDHAGCISELLGARGPIYTVGAACASGNTALRCAVDELRYHDVEAAVIVGAVLDFSPVELHAMALMGAITFQSFNETPQLACRPWDTAREGFVPAHGGGCLVVETLTSAKRRGARIYAEVLGVEAGSDANHLPQPSEDGQARVMKRLLDKCGIAPEQVDYINAHATSTPLGDLTEIRSIKRVFGDHAYKLKLNATKSMLGHTCWAAPTVETIAAVLQMRAGKLHPSINIENLDPEVDLDICRGTTPVDWPVKTLLKNSFGFGGINCVSLIAKYEDRP
ncbi:MAG TPA: beta-ketoacyl-[acyl-carrier-protein] synthase family protein [Kofleriaceae bacterium]